MKKTYKTPKSILLEMDTQELLAASGGLNDGDTLGGGVPKGDKEGNIFSKRLGGLLMDDEFQGSDISDNNGIFRSAEENSDDATIVNHY